MDESLQRFVSGDSTRIFINPALGCQSNCSYCYLEDEGFSLGSAVDKEISSEQCIELVEESGLFIPGENGSIISIGCFSECWDKKNIETTKNIILYFLKKRNPVQFATKRSVKPYQVIEIANNILWKGQLCLFVSSASITHWKKIEKGTTIPKQRFRHLKQLISMGILSHLYIKPVIDDITILDLDAYKEILVSTSCDVVVGSRFSKHQNSVLSSPLPSISGLKVINSTDEHQIKLALNELGKVYSTSVEATNYWRAIVND
ncbi:hypothetical protein [Marinobacterium stanieri]|uniref:hypothetical protein n=1 Tax=Marinobacterium stanieri TaxID=49186 RepID=UPI001112267E|nr:hypothetical protein [Marinobacterium stanieri]